MSSFPTFAVLRRGSSFRRFRSFDRLLDFLPRDRDRSYRRRPSLGLVPDRLLLSLDLDLDLEDLDGLDLVDIELPRLSFEDPVLLLGSGFVSLGSEDLVFPSIRLTPKGLDIFPSSAPPPGLSSRDGLSNSGLALFQSLPGL